MSSDVYEIVADLTESLLTDEKGISEESYNKLYLLLQECGLGYLTKYVDACDGRFYIPSGE